MFGRIRKALSGSESVATKSLTEVEAKRAYEQQERQRRNPYVYTTLDQCVNADGTITTFDQVTRKIQETLSKFQEYHRRQFTGEHPDFCMKGMESDVCKIIEYCTEEMDKVRVTFVRNYQIMREREHHRVNDLEPSDANATTG